MKQGRSASSIDELQATFDKALDERFALAARGAAPSSDGRARPRRRESRSTRSKAAAAARSRTATRRSSRSASALAEAGDRGRVRAAREGRGAGAGRHRRRQPARADGAGSPRSWAITPRAMQGVSGAARPRSYGGRAGAPAARARREGRRRARCSRSRTTASSRSIRSMPRRTPARAAGAEAAAMRRSRCASSRRRCRPAPPTRPPAHCDLGESYLLAGRPADAKREALAALEIAPSFERAQELAAQGDRGEVGAAGGRAMTPASLPAGGRRSALLLCAGRA